ncbi:MAG TPA: SDR family NAD(P)-dependent oxidoreductase [Blastocatellia bacterium]|nr:SDR family NAD(P)-dependent oxidoreductase [Blastocatellia bacterium]
MGSVAFITGASSGIGRALALELAARGCGLALAARRKEVLEDLTNGVSKQGGEALALACDVGDQGQVRRAVADTLQRFGRVDLALLSAGVGRPTVAAKFKAADFAEQIETNLMGVAYCLEELIPVMLNQQPSGGTIAAISSLAGDRGIPGSGGYSASKAAVNALFDGMRAHLARRRIRLVTIAPGFVRTPMTERNGRMPFLMEADEAARLILRRIARGDRVIRFPLPTSMAMGLLRFLPARLFDALLGGRQADRKEK